MKLKMTTTQLQIFLRDKFPQVSDDFKLLDLTPDELCLGMTVSHDKLRPGGTVAGPSMFALADLAIYLAILARIGPVALAVTTSCSIDFMRKPRPDTDMLARARILKLGRILAVGDVLLYSVGQDAPVARASLTYSIPPGHAGAASAPT